MALNKNEYIDATMMGSIARFMNHSCNPNCLLQKWTVGNKTRMGMFTKRRIPKGQELTFDYRMERYGNKAQPCYCGESVCTGFIGGGSTASEEFDLEAYMAPKKISKSKRSVFKELEREEEGASQWKKGLQTREDVEGYCRFFLKNTEDLVRLPAFMHVLQETPEELRGWFGRVHGYLMLKHALKAATSNIQVLVHILQGIHVMPVKTKVYVVNVGLYKAVEALLNSDDLRVAALAQAIINDWDTKSVYVIPKKPPTKPVPAKEEPVPPPAALPELEAPLPKGPAAMSQGGFELEAMDSSSRGWGRPMRGRGVSMPKRVDQNGWDNRDRFNGRPPPPSRTTADDGRTSQDRPGGHFQESMRPREPPHHRQEWNRPPEPRNYPPPPDRRQEHHRSQEHHRQPEHHRPQEDVRWPHDRNNNGHRGPSTLRDGRESYPDQRRPDGPYRRETHEQARRNDGWSAPVDERRSTTWDTARTQSAGWSTMSSTPTRPTNGSPWSAPNTATTRTSLSEPVTVQHVQREPIDSQANVTPFRSDQNNVTDAPSGKKRKHSHDADTPAIFKKRLEKLVSMFLVRELSRHKDELADTFKTEAKNMALYVVEKEYKRDSKSFPKEDDELKKRVRKYVNACMIKLREKKTKRQEVKLA